MNMLVNDLLALSTLFISLLNRGQLLDFSPPVVATALVMYTICILAKNLTLVVTNNRIEKITILLQIKISTKEKNREK